MNLNPLSKIKKQNANPSKHDSKTSNNSSSNIKKIQQNKNKNKNKNRNRNRNKKKKKKQPQTKRRDPNKFKFSYVISPTNFVNLKPEKKVERLHEFFDVLKVIDDRIKITISNKVLPIVIEGQTTESKIIQVHLESHKPLGINLERNGFDYIEGERPPNLKITKEKLGEMQLELDSQKFHSKIMTLHSVPSQLPPAWITQVFSLCSQVQMWFSPIPKKAAIKRMAMFKNVIYEDSKKDKVLAEIHKNADDTEVQLKQGKTQLFEVVTNCTVASPLKKGTVNSNEKFQKRDKKHRRLFCRDPIKECRNAVRRVWKEDDIYYWQLRHTLLLCLS